jgi:hypothetical protein
VQGFVLGTGMHYPDRAPGHGTVLLLMSTRYRFHLSLSQKTTCDMENGQGPFSSKYVKIVIISDIDLY